MKIKSRNKNITICNNEIVFSPFRKVKFDSFESYCEIPEIEELIKNPETLAWIMPKPRPSVYALAMVYAGLGSEEIEFRFDEYRSLVKDEKQQDIDLNFVRKHLQSTRIKTESLQWNLSFEKPIKTEISGNNAYITYFSGRYILGLIALIRSIRRFTNTKIIVLCSDTEIVSPILKEKNVEICQIKPINNPNAHGQSRFKDTYNKLRIFDFVEYDKLVYIDSDCIVLKNVDILFNLQTEISAAPDWGLKYAKGFNSGVLVFTPSDKLRKIIEEGLKHNIASADGGDQGFLNEILKDKITYIPPEYNYLKRNYDKRSWVFDKENISILHYVGVKPWDILDFDPKYENLNQLWLDVLNKEDLLILFKFSKIYASRRATKFNETLKIKDSEIKTLKALRPASKSSPEPKKSNKSHIRNILIKIWNKLP